MVGSDIVSRLGSGSGIDTGSLISDLVEINHAPQLERLDKREELLQTQISDYGLLRSALSSLESAVAAVSNKDTFDAKAVSLPDTSLIALTKLNATAAAGDYRLEIEGTAQSHSLSSGVFSSSTATIGKGEIALRFGDWNGALDSFSVNPDKTGTTITIDDTNNTLEGLRDAINAEGIGVQASIVSDGSGYRLLLTGPSGASHELELSVTEDPLSPGLSDFAFNESSQVLSQQQEGKDALIRVNGLLVTRSSNRVTDVIQGLEFDIFNSSASEVINISISADRSIAEQAIRDFVTAYNTFFADMEKLTGFDAELDDYGSLRHDSLAKNLRETIRGFIGASVPGLEEGFTTLANLAIRTRRDGTLEINEDPNEPNTNFRAAMDKHFDMVRDLFVPITQSDNAKVAVNGFTARSQPGSYEVVISQQASKGGYVADPAAVGFPLDTTGKDYSFEVELDGVGAASIALPDGKVYATGAELAADFQALINLDESLQEARVSLSVSFNSGTGALEFTSNEFGSDSRVSFVNVGADMGDLGITVGAGTGGTNVVGTIDGKAGFGYGNVLLPALNSPAEGLSLTVGEGVTTATITFSRGFAGGLSNVIDDFLASNGLIKGREDNIKDGLVEIVDDRATLDRRTEAYRLRLESQFLAMELIVNNLNNTGSFLEGILDRLPFTAKK